jgi:hypothetical protein
MQLFCGRAAWLVLELVSIELPRERGQLWLFVARMILPFFLSVLMNIYPDDPDVIIEVALYVLAT